MSRKDIITAVAGFLLVAAIATFAIVSAVQADDNGDDLSARVAELEERVEELEDQLQRGPFGLRGGDSLGQLFGQFFGDEDFSGFQERFGQGSPEDLLDDLLRSFVGDLELDQLSEFGDLEDPDQLREIIEQLRDALEGAFDQ